jgi:hypothetical protein
MSGQRGRSDHLKVLEAPGHLAVMRLANRRRTAFASSRLDLSDATAGYLLG